MSKPKILVARAIFPETIERLSQHFEVESNQSDESWSKEQLIAKLRASRAPSPPAASASTPRCSTPVPT
jgi:gluconate 2-dehydrogenase